MRKPLEIIHGEKTLRLNLYLYITSYCLLIILVESLVDFILMSFFEWKNPDLIEELNKLKLLLSTIIYTVLGLIPAFFASWFGYRIIASSKLPPVLLSGKTRFPFTVVVVKGRPAKMFGVLIIIVSLLLIFQLLLHAIKVFLL